MYLYDKNGDKIEVYSMEPNMEKIYNFRKKEMEKIPENERVLKMVSNKFMDWSIFYTGIIDISNDDFSKKSIFNFRYCDLIQYDMTGKEQDRLNKLLEGYYKGNYFYYKIRVNKKSDEIKGLQTIKRLLLNNDCLGDKRHKYAINDIISVPESILLLEFLLSKDFQMIKEEDISEQLKLFDFSNNPIETVDYSKIKNYIDLGILPYQSTYQLDCKVEHSQKILKYIKK